MKRALDALEWATLWVDAIWFGFRHWTVREACIYERPMRCSCCQKWFCKGSFWNPIGTNRGKLCCSFDCCEKMSDEPLPEELR